MRKFKCVVCNSPLTREQYEAALGIWEEKERILKDERAKLAKEKADLQQKLREARQREKLAREEGVTAERKRTKRLLAGKEEEIQKLKDRVRQIQQGTTPQTEGLEFEDKLFARLKKEFPEDEFEHTGKGGDILHFVRFEKETAGIIVYECKRCPAIETSHFRQALAAKKQRDADFAVLVTTGKRFATREKNKGFTGFTLREGVLIISPLGVIPLASLLRTNVIEMARAKIDKDKRAIIASRLVEFITSPQVKNQIDGVVRSSVELQAMIKIEARDHFKIWQRRWEYYQTIHWDVSQIKSNLGLILHGQEPKELKPPKGSRLQLPAISEI